MSAAYSGASGDVKRLFGRIAERYDLTNSVLSFGIHHLWRFLLLRRLPSDSSAVVLDVACGTGDLTRRLSRRYRTVLGADFCEPMLRVGIRAASSRPPAAFLQADALGLPFPDASFDIVTVAFGVRNFEDLDRGLRELKRVLKPGGTLAVLEFGQPTSRIVAAAYRLYSRHILPFVGGMLTGDREAYRYLDDTAGRFPCGAEFCRRLRACGFVSAEDAALTGGIAYRYLAS